VFAAAYARRLVPLDVRFVHFAPEGTDINSMIDGWGDLGEILDLRLRTRSIGEEIRRLAREMRADSGEDALINVIMPEVVRHTPWRHALHNVHVQRIKSRLVAEANVIVTSVVAHTGYEALEPVGHPSDQRRAMEGWRHVAVVLVSGVHNATAQSIRYAASLRADAIRYVHVAVDGHASEDVRTSWEERYPDLPLEVVPSPYRQIGGPIHGWVRDILEEDARTFVTIVIPEFVVRRTWHRLLHNQTAATLRRTFLSEPSVVVSSVPYRL
jgi:hypothetical protein